MTSNIKIFILCPVPEEQKPINEYIQLKENSFQSWQNFSFSQKLVILFAFLGLNSWSFVDLQIKYQTFNPNIFLEKFVINSLIIFTFLFFLVLINFLRWKQISTKFKRARIIYEEISWYDGQIWEKPFSVLKNDKLLNLIKIQPFLKQCFFVFFLLLVCFCFFSFVWLNNF